jgi:hypothetical protein
MSDFIVSLGLCCCVLTEGCVRIARWDRGVWGTSEEAIDAQAENSLEGGVLAREEP